MLPSLGFAGAAGTGAALVETTTAWTRGTTAAQADRSGGVAWSGTANVADASETTEEVVYTYNSPYTSDWMRVTNFGFSIPTGATIKGIEMRQKCRRYDPSSGTNRTLEIFARKTSGQVGTNIVSSPAQFATTLTWEAWGGASNLWGTTWSAADINSSDFGFDVSHQGNASDGITYISQVQCRVTYEA